LRLFLGFRCLLLRSWLLLSQERPADDSNWLLLTSQHFWVFLMCTAIDLTNVAILGYLGKDALAGSAFAGVVTTISAIVLWQGFGDALIALSSQAIGANNHKLAGIWLQTSLLAITIGSLPVAVIWWNAGNLLRAASPLFGSAGGPSDEVINYSEQFARYSLVWLLPDAWASAFSQWLNGQQKVKPTIGLNALFVVYNAFVNYFMVYGGLGTEFKGLGFIGSPIATSTTKILRGFCLVIWCCKFKGVHKDCWGGWKREAISTIRMKRFFSQAIPAACVGFVEQAQFVFITLLVGTIGDHETELAAHSGMLNVFR